MKYPSVSWFGSAIVLTMGLASGCGESASNPAGPGQGGSSQAGGAGGGDQEPGTGGKGTGGASDGGTGGTAPDTKGETGGSGGTTTQSGGTGGRATGGSPGTTSTGGSGGTPPVASDCGSLSACETFEGFADGSYPATARFKSTGAGSTFTIVSDEKKSGKKSLKVMSPKTSGAAMVTLGGIAGITNGGGTVYARMMVRFAPSVIPTTRDGKEPHWKMLRMIETNPGGGGVVSAGVVGADRGRMLYLASGADCAADGGVIPANVWTCVEMRADATGYQTWIDGKTSGVAASTASGCWKKHTAVQSIGFGFELAAASRVRDDTFWLDDLAIGTKRIGCP